MFSDGVEASGAYLCETCWDGNFVGCEGCGNLFQNSPFTIVRRQHPWNAGATMNYCHTCQPPTAAEVTAIRALPPPPVRAPLLWTEPLVDTIVLPAESQAETQVETQQATQLEAQSETETETPQPDMQTIAQLTQQATQLETGRATPQPDMQIVAQLDALLEAQLETDTPPPSDL